MRVEDRSLAVLWLVLGSKDEWLWCSVDTGLSLRLVKSPMAVGFGVSYGVDGTSRPAG